jgi:polysaccharide export outer membrane protein
MPIRASSVLRSAIALLVPALLWGCATATRTNVERVEVPTPIAQTTARFTKEYVLFAGDQVEVLVSRFPEVSRTVSIRSDGMISLPLLQDVPAAGLSARELAADLTKRFAARLVNPEVTVIPTQVRQPQVFVLGDVKNPQPVPYRNAQTALQAIGMAGGFQRSGAEADVTIIRLSRDGHLEAIPINVEATGQPGPYLAFAVTALQPDDVIFVPEHGRAQMVRFFDEIILRPAQLFITYKLYQQL